MKESLFFDVKLEEALLSAILNGKEKTYLETMNVLGEFDSSLFFNSSHRAIFEVIHQVYQELNVIDPVILAERMVERGRVPPEGIILIYDLMEAPHDTEHVPQYVRELLKMKMRRELGRFAGDVERLTKDPDLEIQDLLGHVSGMLSSIEAKLESEGENLEDTLDAIVQGNAAKRMVFTGFQELDSLIGSLEAGEIAVIAARPGQGKSTMAMNIALKNLDACPIVFIQYEMTPKQVLARMLSAISRVPYRKILYQEMTDEERFRMKRAAERIRNASIHIISSPLSPSSLRIALSRLKRVLGPEMLVFLDYLQLVPADFKARDSYERVTSVSRSLKNLAIELEIPVFLLSQLSRRSELRESREPELSDLRDSGAIEEDASAVIMLHRPGFYDKNIPDEKIFTFVKKARHGTTGECIYEWDGETYRIGKPKILL